MPDGDKRYKKMRCRDREWILWVSYIYRERVVKEGLALEEIWDKSVSGWEDRNAEA